MVEARHETDFFLNVPYDRGYEPLFIALLATLISLGQKPHCTLEIPEHGQGRLIKIFELLERCPRSIHDLSRVGQPARFNMPFELGLAWAVRRYSSNKNHAIFMLEKVRHRLAKTLGDVDGHQPYIHSGTPRGVISCVFEFSRVFVYGTEKQIPDVNTVYGLWKDLRAASYKLKAEEHSEDIYSGRLFARLCDAAIIKAKNNGFILS